MRSFSLPGERFEPPRILIILALTAISAQRAVAGDVVICQSYYATVDRELQEIAEVDQSIRALAADVASRLDPFLTCQDRQEIYVPSHSRADGEGCVDPTKLEGLKGPRGDRGPAGRSKWCAR